MAASTDELVDIVFDVDLNIEPACESREHPESPAWHEGPAAYWFRGPHGGRGLVCEKWATAIRTLGAHCNGCGGDHRPNEFTFIEL